MPFIVISNRFSSIVKRNLEGRRYKEHLSEKNCVRAAFCGVLPCKVETTRKNIYWFKKNRYVNREQVKWHCRFFPWAKKVQWSLQRVQISPISSSSSPPRRTKDLELSRHKVSVRSWYGNEIQGKGSDTFILLSLRRTLRPHYWLL